MATRKYGLSVVLGHARRRAARCPFWTCHASLRRSGTYRSFALRCRCRDSGVRSPEIGLAGPPGHGRARRVRGPLGCRVDRAAQQGPEGACGVPCRRCRDVAVVMRHGPAAVGRWLRCRASFGVVVGLGFALVPRREGAGEISYCQSADTPHTLRGSAGIRGIRGWERGDSACWVAGLPIVYLQLFVGQTLYLATTFLTG